jgi:acyl-CoA synthetase (AMP-forming)/AMP-acid ligase II
VKLIGAVPVPADVRSGYVAQGLWADAGLRDGLEAWAGRTPDRVAVVDATSGWSYQELVVAVGTALGGLRHRGVGAGSVVLVIAPVSAPSVAVYHAVLRSGGVVVMLDRRCGPADVEHAVAAAGVELVVVAPELAQKLRTDRLGLPTVSFEELLACTAPVHDWPEPEPGRPIAAVFTSGTTSRPKCVVHSLDTLRSGGRNLAEAMRVTERDVAFLSTPLASITGLVQTHMMLDRGAGLLLEDRFEPAASLRRLREHGATLLGGAPVIIEELFKRADAGGVRELPLRAMALGGAMIPREILELALDRYGITPVRMYGSSEVPCATGTLPSDTGEARIRDDGACARGTEARAAGEPPEILVRGPMRFLGYLDEQDNRAAFVEGGWFRTGDLGQVQDGRLTVSGRLKETVSRKGLKISLSEIDDIVRGLPGAQEAAAFGLPDPETGERLVIALRPQVCAEFDFDAVIGWLLAAGLAKWKLPEQVVLWDGPLPRTQSGKVQRRVLAEGAERRTSLLAPRLRQ